jgi:hypothetical protein
MEAWTETMTGTTAAITSTASLDPKPYVVDETATSLILTVHE